MSGKDVYSYARVTPLQFRQDVPMHLGLHSLDDGKTEEALALVFPELVPPKAKSAEDKVCCLRLRMLCLIELRVHVSHFRCCRESEKDGGLQEHKKPSSLSRRGRHRSIHCVSTTGMKRTVQNLSGCTLAKRQKQFYFAGNCVDNCMLNAKSSCLLQCRRILEEAVRMLHFQTKCTWARLLQEIQMSVKRGLHGLVKNMTTPTNLYRIVEVDGVSFGQLRSFFRFPSSETQTDMRKTKDLQFKRVKRVLHFSTYREWAQNFPDPTYACTISPTHSVIVCPCAFATESYNVKDSALAGLGLESPLYDLSVEHDIHSAGASVDALSARRTLLLILDKQVIAARVFFLVIVCGSPTNPQRGEDTFCVGGVSVFGKCGWVPFINIQMRSLPHVSYVDHIDIETQQSAPAKLRILFRPLLVSKHGHVLDFST